MEHQALDAYINRKEWGVEGSIERREEHYLMVALLLKDGYDETHRKWDIKVYCADLQGSI